MNNSDVPNLFSSLAIQFRQFNVESLNSNWFSIYVTSRDWFGKLCKWSEIVEPMSFWNLNNSHTWWYLLSIVRYWLSLLSKYQVSNNVNYYTINTRHTKKNIWILYNFQTLTAIQHPQFAAIAENSFNTRFITPCTLPYINRTNEQVYKQSILKKRSMFLYVHNCCRKREQI